MPHRLMLVGLPVILLTAMLAAVVCAETASAPQAAAAAPAAGSMSKLLDQTRLPDLESTVASLRERMGAKGLLIVFVDTTCPFAATAIKEMSTVASVLAKQNVNSLLININEPGQVVKDFYASHPAGVPVLYDSGKDTQTAWAVTAVPTVIVVNAAGDTVYRGTAVWADVAAAVEKDLKLSPGTINFTVQGTGKG